MLLTNLRLSLVLLLICGLVYPLAMTGIAQVVMPAKASVSCKKSKSCATCLALTKNNSVAFNDRTEVLQPLVALSSKATRDEVIQKLLNQTGTDGGTRIGLALQEGLAQLQASNQLENSTVVLMSDGYSDLDIPSTLAPFKQNHVLIHTVGMSKIDAAGTSLLEQIAAETGGRYFNVDHADEMTGIFGQIYDMSRQDRNLVTERTGATEESLFYTILRVVSLLIIGGLLGLALGLIFDNRHLAKSFTIGGAVAGLLAGLVLEMGLMSIDLLDMVIRLIALALLAVVLTIFTVFFPASASGGATSRQKRMVSGRRSAGGLEAGKRSSKRGEL